MDYIPVLLFLCPVMFLASFVDAVSGGGGLLSLPAYLFTGIPVHNAYACNKIATCASSFISSRRFFKNGMMGKKAALVTGSIAFLCSVLSSGVVLFLTEYTLKILVLFSMPFVAGLILVNRKYPEKDESDGMGRKRFFGTCVGIGVIMGFYDGLLGPGSGTLAILLYTKFLKYDLKKASGNAKAAVFASTLAATLSFIAAGKVIWSIAAPVTLCGILGGYAGAGMAIKKGARFIRPMMLFIASLLILKMALELMGFV